MRNAGGRRTRPHGFTLMEVMIALVLISFVMTLLFAGLRLVSRSWESGEARAAENSQVRAVQELLRAKLRQSWGLQLQTDRGIFSAFSGTNRQMRFVAPMMNQLGPGGLYLVEIGTQRDVLSLRLVPYQRVGWEKELASAKSYPLIEGVESYRFSYFGAEDPTRDPVWLTSWEERNEPPLLVRIEVRRKGEKWPDIVVPLAR